jgi:N-acyl-L-homoserine lactone synthetase
MPLRTKIASSDAELDACFQLRHRVFVEQDSKFQNQPDGRLLDRFDTFDVTTVFYAEEAGSLVGTIRVTLKNEQVGMPADDYFDFSQHIPGDAGRIANLSQLCVEAEGRGQLRVVNGLFNLIYYWGHENQVTHFLAPFNPRLTRTMQRIGFTPIGDVVTSRHHGLEIQPMILDVQNIRQSFVSFLLKQDIHKFMEPYVREYYSEGEKVVTRGDRGENAYFVVDGVAEVVLDRTDGTLVKIEVGKGEVIGELAMVADIPRTADVVAKSNLQLIPLTRRQLINCVRNNGEDALFLLRTLSHRLASALVYKRQPIADQEPPLV